MEASQPVNRWERQEAGADGRIPPTTDWCLQQFAFSYSRNTHILFRHLQFDRDETLVSFTLPLPIHTLYFLFTLLFLWMPKTFCQFPLEPFIYFFLNFPSKIPPPNRSSRSDTLMRFFLFFCCITHFGISTGKTTWRVAYQIEDFLCKASSLIFFINLDFSQVLLT